MKTRTPKVTLLSREQLLRAVAQQEAWAVVDRRNGDVMGYAPTRRLARGVRSGLVSLKRPIPATVLRVDIRVRGARA